MAREDGDGSPVRGADVEGTDQAIDAGGGDDAVSVFVPVVGEGFGGGDARPGWPAGSGEGRGV